MNETPTTQDHAALPRQATQFASSTSLGKLGDALAKAQGAIEGAKKDADNPFFRSKYADLASVWDACRAPLSKNGLAVIQLPGSNGDGLFVDTILTHASGEWISSRLYIKPGYTSKDGQFVALSDPQALGSAITYGRRYGLQAIVGIAPEDDDGNAASAIEKRQAQREEAASHAGREHPEPGAVHFGKNKGKTPAELDNRQLTWYRKNHEEAVAAGKKRSDADMALYEAVKAEIEKRHDPANESQVTPPAAGSPEDTIPMYNGPKHEALAKRLKEELVAVEEFMEAAKWAKQIPESAKAFGHMTDATAAKFIDDTEVLDNMIKMFRQHLKKEAA